MIRNYITQALTMMRQHKLFTGIYIGGTAISLALAMTLFMMFHLKLSPAYPEYERNRTLNFGGVDFTDFEPKTHDNLVKFLGTKLSGYFASEKIVEIDGVEMVALTTSCDITCVSTPKEKEAGRAGLLSEPKCVDANYWRMFNFEFIHGAPFTADELCDAKAVVSESFAKELFARNDVAGEKLILDNKEECIIVGVVRDALPCMTNTKYDVYFPLHYSAFKKGQNNLWESIYTSYDAIITYSRGADVKKIKEEIDNRYRRYVWEKVQEDGITSFDYKIHMMENWEYALACPENSTIWDAIKKYFYIVLAFLFIPALNLSGMIASRMNSRLAEIGVRKAYGATNAQILWQVLCENLFLTLIGSVLGLVLSYTITITFFEYIYTIISGYTPDYDIPVEMLFSPRIFVLTLLLCVLLNIASALLPALFALKKNIVQSLYNKR